jgi:hypothetical protein
MSDDTAVWREMDVGVGVVGGESTGTGGSGDLSFGGRFFALWTRVKDGSGSLGWVFDAEERDGGTFVLIGSGEGGGREAGVEGMSCHSRWNRRGERRKAGKGERGKRTVLSQRQLELCSVAICLFVCLLLCIRLVGGFNGNTNKTRCWSFLLHYWLAVEHCQIRLEKP